MHILPVSYLLSGRIWPSNCESLLQKLCILYLHDSFGVRPVGEAYGVNEISPLNTILLEI